MVERGGGAACERGGRKLFSLGFRGHGGRRRGAGRFDEEEKWVLATKFGRLVKDDKFDLLSGVDLPLGHSSAFESLTQNHLTSDFSLKNKDGRSLLHLMVSTVERLPYVKEAENQYEAYQKALLKESDDGLKVDDEADSVNTTGNNI